MSPVDIVLLIVILSALVVAHEWGHFIMARVFKIRVDDFSVGFGKRLIRIGKLGDTEYNIRAIPLGGFVKIAGMEPDEEPINRAKDAITKRAGSEDAKGSDFSSDLKDDFVDGVDERSKAVSKATDDPDAKLIPLLAENMEDPALYAGPDGFNSKPLWQRSLVILGGPVMSFVTGVAILCLLGCTFGIPIGKSINRVGQVQPKGEGQRIGLQAGDYIIAFNGIPVTSGAEMVQTIHNSVNQTLILTIKRDGEVITLPAAKPRPLLDSKTNKQVTQTDIVSPGILGPLGVLPGDQVARFNNTDIDSQAQFKDLMIKNAGKPVKIDLGRGFDPVEAKLTLPMDIAKALPTTTEHVTGILNFTPDFAIVHLGFKSSVIKGWTSTTSLFEQLGELAKTHQLQKAAGGVVGMAAMTTIARKDGPSQVFLLAAQISISLAIFNMLPIPILDGGHLLAFFIEWIRRGKKMTPSMQNAFMLTGLAIIVLLVVLINGKDIWNRIIGNIPQ